MSSGLTDLLSGRLACFTLVTGRICGFFVTSPIPGVDIPVTIKAGLVITVSWLVASTTQTDVTLGLETLVPLIGELAIGLLAGFVVRIVLSVAETFGESVGHASLLSSPSIFNAQTGMQESVLSRLFSTIGILLLLESGAHRGALGAVIASFHEIPPGHAGASLASTPELVRIFADAVSAGVGIALPLLAVGLLVQFGLGLVSRAAPSLQIFNVGFSVALLGTIAMLASSADAIAGELAQEMNRAPYLISGLLGGGG